jgi:Na+-driven multidrug efflux pump
VGAVTLLLVSFPERAVAVFNDDPEVVAAGASYVLLAGLSQVFMAFEVVLLAAFAGAEWTVVPAVTEMGLTAARVPIAMAIVSSGFGVEGVWIAIAGTTVAKGVMLCLFTLLRQSRSGVRGPRSGSHPT